MTTELQPCPFCGGEAEIHPSSDWDVKFTGTTYFAWCDKCETRGDYYDTEAEAIEAWNKRAAYEAEGYFFLPKPKEQLFYTTPLGIKETESGYAAQTSIQILEEAARRWADEINDEVLRSIIECWNTRAERTCSDQFGGKAWCFKCDTCGCVIPWKDSLNFKTILHGLLNYCPSCGAKVVEQ